jgi:pilus assembly protein Flp/PilA
MRWIRHFVASEDGPTAVEYAVLLALILMAIIGAIGTVGAQTGGMWGNIDSQTQAAGLGAS